ncbi:MAG TPA: SEL1-like repeat protein [Burkholderiales bacterium]|nr:SEL1-like repeat protein [Burkholderiales bacterium]
MANLEQLTLKANADDADAQYALGNAHRYGTGVPQHLPSAMRWYLRAASAGHVPAQVRLGVLFTQDFAQAGLERNVEQARHWLKRAADANDPEAMHLLAKLLLERSSPIFDPTAASSLLQQAADRGCAAACNELGVCYSLGEVVGRDQARAYDLFLRGAHLGDPHAQYNVARCYAEGEGVQSDATQALHWFRQAANRGLLDGALELARMLLEEGRSQENMGDGLSVLKQAADAGHAQAQYEFARQLERGAGAEPDFLSALHYLHEAADQHHSDAMFRLATILHQGTGLDRAYPEQAAVWFKRLVDEHQHGYAAQILGVMHAQGKGVPLDLVRAEALFQRAAALGQNDALLNLALLRAGPSALQDFVVAAKWAMLFDARVGSDESRELVRTLVDLLDDKRLTQARQEAELWATSSQQPDEAVSRKSPRWARDSDASRSAQRSVAQHRYRPIYFRSMPEQGRADRSVSY